MRQPPRPPAPRGSHPAEPRTVTTSGFTATISFRPAGRPVLMPGHCSRRKGSDQRQTPRLAEKRRGQKARRAGGCPGTESGPRGPLAWKQGPCGSCGSANTLTERGSGFLSGLPECRLRSAGEAWGLDGGATDGARRRLCGSFHPRSVPRDLRQRRGNTPDTPVGPALAKSDWLKDHRMTTWVISFTQIFCNNHLLAHMTTCWHTRCQRQSWAEQNSFGDLTAERETEGPNTGTDTIPHSFPLGRVPPLGRQNSYNLKTKTNPLKKWTENLKKRFSKEDIQMTNRYTERGSNVTNHPRNANQSHSERLCPIC